MNLIKNITGILLVVVMATTGIPCYMMEDASCDGMVDLQDAILQVQDFSESAARPVSFSFRFEKMLNTFCSVAGLKKLIDPNKESKSSKHQSTQVVSPERITNSFSIQLPPLLLTRAEFPENSTTYDSRTLDPSIPPPRIS